MPFWPMIDTKPGFNGIVMLSNQPLESEICMARNTARLVVVDWRRGSDKDAILRILQNLFQPLEGCVGFDPA